MKIKLLAVWCAVIFTGNCYAQKKDSSSITERNIQVGEVVVSSFRINRKLKELPASMAVTGAYDYQKKSALTLSNVLNTEPGIFMGSDAPWATNVNIRGLGESRLVILVDGNRVETATDLTASLSMVDVNDIERVEVIKGAQSSLYGTGAMGGIVNIITKSGHFASSPYLAGNVISEFASANTLFSNHLAINTGSGKWYFRLSGTYSDADDIRTPEGDLPNSQYTMKNVAAKIGIKPFNNHLFKLQYQRNWSNDVGIPGGAAFSEKAEATYTGISRDLWNASYEIAHLSDKFSSLKINYFRQDISRDVLMKPNIVTTTSLTNGNIKRVIPDTITPSANHLTNGAQLQSTWNLSGKNTLIAGIDVWGRKLTSEREKLITVEVVTPTGSVAKTNKLRRGETPIPKSKFYSAGIFIQDEAHLFHNRLTLTTGGRLDKIRVKNEQGLSVDYLFINGTKSDISTSQRITFEKGTANNLSWSINAGALYKLNADVDLALNLARSFRSPSLEERFKYIDLTNYVRLGNPDLNPEKGYSADLGIRIWKHRFNLQSGIFINRLTDMIVEKSGNFIYTLTSDSQPDTVAALINSNIRKALLYGFDFKFDYNFYNNFVLFGSGSYVRGKDTGEDKNLPQIPPFKGRLGMRYTCSSIGSIELAVIGAAKQNKIAEGETKTDGYMRFDLALSSTDINLSFARLQLFAGIDNITDKSYTNHLSTNRGNITAEPGRNIFVRLKLAF